MKGFKKTTLAVLTIASFASSLSILVSPKSAIALAPQCVGSPGQSGTGWTRLELDKNLEGMWCAWSGEDDVRRLADQ